MTVGLLLMGAGMLWYAVVGPDASLWLLEGAFVVAGAGLAVTTGPAVGLAMSAAPAKWAGLASGVVNLARLVGITMGIAVLGSALAIVSGGATSGAAFSAGVRTAVLVGGVVELIGAAIAFFRVRSANPAAPQTAQAAAKEVCHA